MFIYLNASLQASVYLLRYNAHQRRSEDIHIFGCWSVSAIQTCIQLMVQLIEMTKIESAIKGPAT